MISITIFDYVGVYSPLILLIINTYEFYGQPPYLAGYFIGFLINNFINELLKNLIKQPRPQNQIPFVDDKNLLGPHLYGMPSGHAQIGFYSISFFYFLMGQQYPLIFVALLTIGFITLYQRYKFHRHTIEQLVCGAIVGSLIGYIAFISTKKTLENYKYNKSFI